MSLANRGAMMIRVSIFFAMLVLNWTVTADELSLSSAQGFGFIEAGRFPDSQAKLLARRAATVDAQRNLLEIINGVRVTAGTTVKDMVVESDIIGSRVKGLLRGAFEINSEVSMEEGSWVAQITLAICLNQSDDKCRNRQTLASVTQPNLQPAAPEDRFSVSVVDMEQNDSTLKTAKDSDQFSGLIVDASGVDFSPMLDVRIQTSEGKEVYGPGHVAMGTDWLHWAKNREGALSMIEVIGKTPVLVDVQGLGEQSQLVVSNEVAIEIFSSNLKGGDFLGAGKVVFIVAGS